MLLEHELDGSLREIADATGVPHMTVKRIIERAAADDVTPPS